MSSRLGAVLALVVPFAPAACRRAPLAEATLEGYYRYPKSEADLSLSGPIDSRGHFSLQETNERGVVTGRWEGDFSSPRRRQDDRGPLFGR